MIQHYDEISATQELSFKKAVFDFNDGRPAMRTDEGVAAFEELGALIFGLFLRHFVAGGRWRLCRNVGRKQNGTRGN